MTDNYYCFPDIHGRLDLLTKALDFVHQKNPDGGKIIFLGDYIDRGPNNKGVIESVRAPAPGWQHICLMGNHEDMFVDACYMRGTFYNRGIVMEYSPDAPDFDTACRNIPKDVINWMSNLKLFHIEGNNIFAHANYDASLLPEHQSKTDLLWTRMDDHMAFSSPMGNLHLTHGHTPRKHGPMVAPNRTNLDVGGVFYNRYVVAEYKYGVTGPVNFHEIC